MTPLTTITHIMAMSGRPLIRHGEPRSGTRLWRVLLIFVGHGGPLLGGVLADAQHLPHGWCQAGTATQIPRVRTTSPDLRPGPEVRRGRRRFHLRPGLLAPTGPGTRTHDPAAMNPLQTDENQLLNLAATRPDLLTGPGGAGYGSVGSSSTGPSSPTPTRSPRPTWSTSCRTPKAEPAQPAPLTSATRTFHKGVVLLQPSPKRTMGLHAYGPFVEVAQVDCDGLPVMFVARGRAL